MSSHQEHVFEIRERNHYPSLRISLCITPPHGCLLALTIVMQVGFAMLEVGSVSLKNTKVRKFGPSWAIGELEPVATISLTATIL